MGKRGREKTKQVCLDAISSNTLDTADHFEDSASFSSGSGLNLQGDTESQWFDSCPNFDSEVVVTTLTDNPKKPAAKKLNAWTLTLAGTQMFCLLYIYN